ncbi:hypothetical protein AAG570_013796 [Ranatra chinensis]|uniref:Uncharacterized protein n=1 Tax=Ranatra chinensis TaxID=642074 RepID=A0ABD0YPT8_9HEMI
MFDMVRPLVPMNNGPPPHVYGAPLGPMDYHRPIDRVMPPPYQQPPIRKEEPAGESAWERGLRQAKELLRKSSKRKETEVDFEDKKLNLSITQDEFDKENDYYNRSGSPYPDDHYDRYKSDGKRYRSVSYRFADYGPPAAVPSYYGPSRDSWHYDQSDYHHSRGGSSSIVPPDDYYERKRHKYPSREVIVQRMDKSSWKEESHGERGSGGGRGDEWSDPWMRSKSPSRKVSSRSRKKSYSSRSSFSSSSSSRSSSYSSYSRSRTGSRSSRSSRSRSRSRARKKAASPLPRRSNKSPVPRAEKRAETERSLHMNPPPPSPRGHAGSPSLRRNPTPPSASERAKGLSARLLAAAMRERSGSKSSWSSSGSDSSGSSSDSSSDSVSSSSSSRVASPVRPPPRLASSSELYSCTSVYNRTGVPSNPGKY